MGVIGILAPPPKKNIDKNPTKITIKWMKNAKTTKNIFN